MITEDGWLSSAIRMPGRPITVGAGFNAGYNPVSGIVFHSAEGWATTLLSQTSQWGYYSAEFPWHLSNLLDGRLIQHYPLTVRCWHGSAFNDSFVGIEHEGVSPEAGKGPLLNDAQIANDRLVIAEVSAWKRWQPKRPAFAGDRTATLYEHKETAWFGGTSTSCPNNRIPWDKILAPAQEDPLNAEREEELGRQRARGYLLDALLRDYDVVPVSEPGNGVLIVELRRDGQAPIAVPVPMRPEVKRGR